jgi:ATP-dependent DNA ligase
VVATGSSSFDRIRHRGYDESVFMWAFDLIEIDGDDLRQSVPAEA